VGRGLYPGSEKSAYAGIGAIISDYEGADVSTEHPGEDGNGPPVRKRES
jgi:hypothetical protein